MTKLPSFTPFGGILLVAISSSMTGFSTSQAQSADGAQARPAADDLEISGPEEYVASVVRLRKVSVDLESERWERLGGKRKSGQWITAVRFLAPSDRWVALRVQGCWGETPAYSNPPDRFGAKFGVVFTGPIQWAEGPVAGSDELKELANLPVRRVELQLTNLTDRMLEPLPHLDRLTELNCGFMTIGDEAATFLGRCASLEKLSLWDTRITDRGVGELSRLAKLRSLSLGGTPITGRTLGELKALYRLETLHLHGTNLDDDGAMQLATFPLLDTLSVSSTKVSDKCLPMIAGLEYLRTLDLGGTRITNAGVAELTRCPRLTTLWLDDTQVDDECLETLARIPTLRRVDLRNTAITEKEARRFHLRTDRLQVHHDKFDGDAKERDPAHIQVFGGSVYRGR